MAKPRIIVLAGPNGAGKTTASKHLLRDALGIGEFVNADIIAAGLSGFAPESVAFEAGRIVLNRIHTLVDQKVSFAFETTLSSKTLAALLKRAQTAGYEINLIYLALPDAATAVERVAVRVKEGGHDIPIDVIRRRFHRSLEIFRIDSSAARELVHVGEFSVNENLDVSELAAFTTVTSLILNLDEVVNKE